MWSCGDGSSDLRTGDIPTGGQSGTDYLAGSGGGAPAAGSSSTPINQDSGTAIDSGTNKSDSARPSDTGLPVDASQTNDSKVPSELDGAIRDGASPSADTSVDTGATGPNVQGSCDRSAAGSTTVNQTIIVRAGQVYDGQCKRFVAGSALGDGSQSEDQDPVFTLQNGARLVNVILGSPAADGIHCEGNVTLANVIWEDIGEDALTIKKSGTVEIDGGEAYNGSDKVFQINAQSTFRITNFVAKNAGKFIRQNGDDSVNRVDVYINNCDISDMKECIFRTNSPFSSVTMTNTRYHNIGTSGHRLWYDVNPANITESNNTQY
ncbi:MAG: pectate lyase [Deltaproteobacteria bacterium]|nr:pectate lyase [Deltaproteobacteria bacterium]